MQQGAGRVCERSAQCAAAASSAACRVRDTGARAHALRSTAPGECVQPTSRSRVASSMRGQGALPPCRCPPALHSTPNTAAPAPPAGGTTLLGGWLVPHLLAAASSHGHRSGGGLKLVEGAPALGDRGGRTGQQQQRRSVPAAAVVTAAERLSAAPAVQQVQQQRPQPQRQRQGPRQQASLVRHKNAAFLAGRHRAGARQVAAAVLALLAKRLDVFACSKGGGRRVCEWGSRHTWAVDWHRTPATATAAAAPAAAHAHRAASNACSMPQRRTLPFSSGFCVVCSQHGRVGRLPRSPSSAVKACTRYRDGSKR